MLVVALANGWELSRAQCLPAAAFFTKAGFELRLWLSYLAS